MNKATSADRLVVDYFADWVDLYKVGAVRPVTLAKYYATLRSVREIVPRLRLSELDHRTYQAIINEYAVTHERATVADFHGQLKAALLDALDDGLLAGNPFRHVVIKGKPASRQRLACLSRAEFTALLETIDLTPCAINDWLIYLIAKTGLRFSEALGLTPADFDSAQNRVQVSKTWNYKDPAGGFVPTKNVSSNRSIVLDSTTAGNLRRFVADKPENLPLFVCGRVFNTTVNKRLAELCDKAEIPVITLHALRHTHASLLIFAGVSIGSISKRLGHANITITQKVYLHVIRELEDQDNEKITAFLAAGR